MFSKIKKYFIYKLWEIKKYLINSLWEVIEDKTFYGVTLCDMQGKALTHLFLNHVPQIGSFVVYEKNYGIKYRFQVVECEMTADYYRVSFNLKGISVEYQKAVN